MLQCEHVVCLICASNMILSQAKDLSAVNLSEIVCGLCSERTELTQEEQELIYEFLNSEQYAFNDDGEIQEVEEAEDENPLLNFYQKTRAKTEDESENALNDKSVSSKKTEKRLTQHKAFVIQDPVAVSAPKANCESKAQSQSLEQPSSSVK